MTRKITTAIAGAISVLAIAAYASPAGQAPTDASARLIGITGKPMGVVLFHQTPKGVRIDIEASGLVPGVHAIHIHAVGKCEQGMAFKSAGGHFDVGAHAHGKLDPHGPHTGDMDNQTANKLGFLRATLTDASITLGAGPNSVFDVDGSSVVIHAGPDDYKSQPAGASGDRVACGVIKAM